jgi:hypothetical protein
VKDDIDARVRDLRTAIEAARSVPMSASVMLNKLELNAMIDALVAAVDDTLRRATEVVGDRDAFVDTGRLEAIEILREAEQKSQDLISDTDVFKLGKLRAEEVVRAAEAEAEALRAETDGYVEAKLANFEHTVEKAADQIRLTQGHLARGELVENAALRAESNQYVAEMLTELDNTLAAMATVARKGRAQLSGGHVHGLSDDTDVGGIVLPTHLLRE